jgi:hypothetical protein
MMAKCPCQNCGGNVEFEVVDFSQSGEGANQIFGQTIDCPHCGKPTPLYLQKSYFDPKRVNPERKSTSPIFWFFLLWLIVGVVILS